MEQITGRPEGWTMLEPAYVGTDSLAVYSLSTVFLMASWQLRTGVEKADGCIGKWLGFGRAGWQEENASPLQTQDS